MSEGCLHMHNCFISTDLIIHLSLLPSIDTLSSSLSLSLPFFLYLSPLLPASLLQMQLSLLLLMKFVQNYLQARALTFLVSILTSANI